jgi:gliding motility-associated-like protein
VGGSGNLNDGNHWSLTSGGSSANQIPNANTDLIFDDRSTADYSNPVITIVGVNYCKSLKFTNDFVKYTVTGTKYTELVIGGDFEVNYNTNFATNSKLSFTSSSNQYKNVRFNKNPYNGDVVFKDGNWNLKNINIDNSNSLNFISGNYKIASAAIKTGNFYANTNAVNFDFKKGKLDVENVIEIGVNSHFVSDDLIIKADQTDLNNYKVNPQVNFGSDFKIINSSNSSNSTNVACTAVLTSTGISCSGVCDGKIVLTIDVSCAPGPYTLNWTNLTCALPTLTLVPGPGSYTVSGMCSCADFYDVAVYTAGMVPIAFSNAVNIPGVSAINLVPFSFVQPTCFGLCNGSITGNVSGSVGPYTVTVNGVASNSFAVAAGINTFTNLCAGTNTFVVVDTKGCSRTFTNTLTQPLALSSTSITSSVTCNSACNGSISISPINGTAGYTVNFSPGGTFTVPAAGSATVGSLCPGLVSYTITDTKGCTVNSNTTIVQPLALTSVATQTNVSCGGSCDGTASVTVFGGTAPYNYVWSPGPTVNANNITALCAGTQTVSILDANLCPTTKNYTITSPPPITITPTFTNASCNGSCNATASASATGGTGLITFTWIATGPATIAVNASSVTNLCAGSYTVFAKDATGCSTTAIVVITQPPALTLTAVSQSITCFGLCNGGATVTPSGGNGAPFSYTWAAVPPTGQGTPIISNVCIAGVYTVAVTDKSLCPISTTISITQPSSVTPNITTSSVSCNGGNNGSINANPTPLASGPFSYTLASGSATIFTAPPYPNLIAGTYTLTIGYGAGCTQTFAVNVLQPNPLVPSISSTSVTCFNSCNGTLAGSALGGTPAYTFTWTTPTGTVSGGALAGQCAGNYIFGVTDANGCAATLTTSLAQPPDITVTINPTNVSCFASCNGVLSAVVSGGTPGYTLNWSNGPTGNPNVGLCAGNYTLTVTDSKGCIKTATSSITAPPAITLTQTTTPTSCAGGCNGSATITAGGGTAPFTYQFNTIPVTTNATGIIAGLCAGNYVATVTDANGCSQSINFSITSPIALSAAITGLQSSCNACTGASTVTASNGTPGYTYVWTNSLAVSVGTNAAVGALCPGSYTATVTDSKGCTATATANIVQTVTVTVVTAGAGIQCFGAFTGSATANGLGGTLPYTYSWSPTGPPTQTTQSATGLGAGSYTVVVTDQLGCSNTGTIAFANPPIINIAATQTNVTCFGNSNGAINSNASGGTGVLTYSWSPGAITTPNLSGLSAGNYTVKVTDANGCTKTQSFVISSSTSITATSTITNPTGCLLNNGSVCVTASGGTGPGYTYTWTPAGGVGAATSCYSSLSPGSYSLVLADAAGCTTTLSSIITNPAGPVLNITTQSVSCFGGNTGAATVTAVGGGPFTFTWTPVVGFTTIGNTTTGSSMVTGTYNISVTNIPTGCITTQSIGITQPAASLTINSTVTAAKCFGSCNGSITVVAAGGTPGYNYSWLPALPPITGQNTPTVTNLCANNYTLNITDLNLCPSQFTFAITQPVALTLTTTASNVLCNAACNGTINVSGGGGTAPITYTWLPVGLFVGSNNPNIFGLCPNVYTVNASDAHNCPITTTVQITQPTALSTTLTLVNASCSNSCNATASLSVGGGVPTYSFSWSNGPATTSSVNSLCAGNYTGTVVDANGCISATGFTVTAPSAFNVTLTPTNPLCNAACNGSIATVLGGNQGAVTYNWVAAGVGQNPTGLCAGSYVLTATDAAGCVANGVANLVNPPAVLANVTSTNPACNGNCNGIAISTPANATGTVSYSWLPALPPLTGQGTQTVSSLCAGNYSVTIQDQNGCTDVQTFTLTNPPVLNVNTSIAPATCGVSNGSITAIPVGGTPAYTFSWTAPVSSTNAAVSGLAAGVYTVIVTDFNLCTNTLTIPLSNSNGPSAAPITSSSISCNAQCTGAASINIAGIVGGTPGYTVSWVVPPSASTVNPQTFLCAGTYSAQITDANNCLLFNSVVIAQPAAISILPNLTFPTCNGSCDGLIALATSGGTGPYTYTWNPGVSATATLINACAGNYTILIGNNGCPASTQTLNLPAAQNMTATAVTTSNTCFGNCLGTASVTSVIGSPNLPISYVWSNSQVGPSASNLCNGVYTYTATDAIGCFNTFTTTIISPTQISAVNAVASPSCNMCNGASTVTAAGGTAPYTYSWTSSAVGSTATNLCAGLYQVLITDANLCTQLQNINISNSTGIAGDIPTIQNELCAGQCNGAATVVAVGGNAPITYNWISPAVTNSVITNLCSGTYFLQMTDVQGCIRTTFVDINAAAQLTLTPSIISPSCTMANGTINVVASGGNPLPFYNYSWAPVVGITSSLTNIPAGNYTVTVTDGSGCQKVQAFSINNPGGPVITYTQSNVLCFGTPTGSIIALGTSTSAPITYNWSNGATVPTVSGLGAGVITLTVTTPSNGCVSVQSFSISSNPALQLSLANIIQPKCHDDCNGAITLVPSGGVLPYTFTWSPAGVANPQTSLCAGPSTAAIVYSATVTDSKGCFVTTNTTLINPASIVLTPTIVNSSCSTIPDGILNIGVIGGTPVYTYTWTGPSAFTATTQNIVNVLAGTYSLSLTDNHGCKKDTTLDVVPTITIIAQAGNDVTVCPTPSVALTGTNSFGAVSYDWYLLPNITNSVANTSSFSASTPPTAPGSYTYILVATSSVSGCADQDTVIVNTYALPFVDAGPTFTIPVFSNVTIGGSPTTSGSVTVTWSPSFTLDDPSLFNPVASNTINTVYTVTVIDLNTGCTSSDTMTVFLYPVIKIPNGFSPNGDTKNEKWIIDNIDQFPDNTVEVYNRWGELLYYYNNYNGQFDGKFKGKDLPVGTYYYVINLNHPAYTKPFTGPLTIFR